jgi:bifunctional DNA-binding transcriptional regulator/antitoxin component of YhaV-PrlF toxin-antitoxin module
LWYNLKRYLLRYLKRYLSFLKINIKNMRRKLEDKNIRKIYKKSDSYAVTIPIEIVRELKIKKGQKVVIKRSGKDIIITDWKK